jgi:hypothetical protein
MYKKCSENIYRTYCDTQFFYIKISENVYFFPIYPIKLKASVCANDKLGTRSNELVVAYFKSF